VMDKMLNMGLFKNEEDRLEVCEEERYVKL
jgi:hypothetical protein